LIEFKSKLAGVRIIVSTRQPHLLQDFKNEYGIEAYFDNEKVAKESNLIFLCALPYQADDILREIWETIQMRNYEVQFKKEISKPIIVSTLAAIGIQKLKILLSEDTLFLKTNVDAKMIKEEVHKSEPTQW